MLQEQPSKEPAPAKGRVLCLTSSFPQTEDDNAGIFVYHLAQDLQSLGWKVDVLAPHAPGVPTREVKNGVQVYRFRYLWPESAETIFKRGSAAVNLRKHPVDYLKLIPLLTLQGGHSLRNIFFGEYDLIHSHWTIPQGFQGMMCSLLTGVPNIVTVHGGDMFSYNGRMMKKVKAMILKHANAVTVNSEFIKQQVQMLAPEHSTVKVIPMGISQQENATLRALSLRSQFRKGNGPLILFTGRLVLAKGVDDLIRSVGLLKEEFPDIRVLIVGDGQDKRDFVRLAHELELEDHITFVGHVAPSNVADYYSAADIFVGPSKKSVDGAREGLGMTFIEAMSARLPVIATRSGGIVDSVKNEETGLLVNEESPHEIAEAVKRLVSDRVLMKKIVENGNVLVSEKYSRQASAQQFSKLFKQQIAFS